MNKKEKEVMRQIKELRLRGDSDTLQAIWYILQDNPKFYKACADALDYIYIKNQMEIKRVKTFFDVASTIAI